MISDDNNTTIAAMEKLLGIGHTTIKKYLKELQDEGIIKRIGPDKGGHWSVLHNK